MNIHYDPYKKDHYVFTCLRQNESISAEDLQLVIVLFRAIHAPTELSGWSKTLVMLLGHITSSLSIIRMLPDAPECFIHQSEKLIGLIRSTQSIDTSEETDLKNPVKGRIAKHPIYAVILQEKSNFASTESESYVSIFITLLVLMRFQNVKKCIQDGSQDKELREVESRTLRYLLNGQLKANEVEELSDNDDWPSFLKKLHRFAQTHHLLSIFEFHSFLVAGRSNNAKQGGSGSTMSSPKKIPTDKSGVRCHNNLSYTSVNVFEDRSLNISSFHVALPNQEAEEELFDVFNVEPSIDETINVEKVEFSVLYGSQLSIQERQLLQLKPNILNDTEVEVLIEQLKVWIMGSYGQKVVASFFMLKAISSKPRDYLENIPISMFPLYGEPDYVNLQDGHWYRADVDLPNAVALDDDTTTSLHNHFSILKLPLPDILVNGLRDVIDGAGEKMLCMKEFLKKQTDSQQLFFEEIRKKLHRPMSEAGIRKLLFGRIALNSSPGNASLLLSNTEFMNPTHLYYLSTSHKKLRKAYQQAVEQLNMRVVHSQEDDLGYYAGSKLCIKKEWVTSLFSSQYQKLIGFSYSGSSTDALINHHNNVSCYTILMLMFNAMHRPRREFGFEHFSVDLERGLLVVADKIHFADSTVRYVPLSQISKQQLESYFAHLRRFAKAIKPTCGAISHRAVANSKQGALLKTTLFSFIERDKWQNISIAHIRELIGDSLWSLPNNSLRHFMCSVLHEFGYGDLATNFLGHAGAGEHVCDTFSLVSPNDIANSSDAIDKVFSFLNIQPIEIDSPRERPVSCNEALASEHYYIPRFLRVLDSKDKNTEEIAKEAFFKHKDAFDCGNLTPDGFVEACDEELEEQLVGDHQKSQFVLAKHQLNSLLLNHFSATRSFPSNIRFFQISTPSAMNIQQLADISLVEKLRKALSNSLIKACTHRTVDIELSVLLVSMIIHGVNLPKLNRKRTAIFSGSFVVEGDFVYLNDSSVEDEEKTYLLDSISSLLAIKLFRIGQIFHLINPVKACNALLADIFDKAEIDTETKALLKSKQLGDVVTLCEYFAQSGTRYTTSLERAYSSGLFSSTPLDQFALKRMVTGEKVEYAVESTEESGGNPQVLLGKNKKRPQDESLSIVIKINNALNELEQSPTRKTHFSEMKKIWADVVQSTEKTRDALLRASDGFSDALVAGLYYLTKVAERNAKKDRQVAVSTLKAYLSKVVKPLVCLLGNERFMFLDTQEYIDIYRNVIGYRNLTDESRGEAARRIRDFHNVLVSDFGIEQVDWFRIEPSIAKRSATVSANVITYTEYEFTFELIKRQTPNLFVSRCCLIIFILSNRGGLRIDDIEGLKVNDFDFENGLLHVKTNHLRRLKTVNSNRIVPLIIMINEQEECLMREQITYSKELHAKHPNPPLFCAHDDATRALNLNRFAWYIMSALKLVAGDKRLGTHHGRHSFSNYLICLFSKMDEAGVLTKQLKQWFRTDDLGQLRKTLSEVLLGKQYEWDTRSVYAVSAALGHASPITTFKNYFHMMHFIQHANNERWLSESIKPRNFAVLTDMSFVNLRQVISRSPYLVGKYRHVLMKVLHQAGLLARAPERETDGVVLPHFTAQKGLSSGMLVKMDLFIKLYLKGYRDGDISEILKLNNDAVLVLMHELRSLIDSASALIFGELIDKDNNVEKTHHYTFEFVHDPFFKSIMVQWAKLTERGDINNKVVTQEWRNNLFGDVYIVESPDNNVIVEAVEMVGLFYKVKLLGPTKQKWLQKECGYELKVYRSNQSDRSWTRKFHYLMLLNYLFQKSTVETLDNNLSTQDNF